MILLYKKTDCYYVSKQRICLCFGEQKLFKINKFCGVKNRLFISKLISLIFVAITKKNKCNLLKEN